MRIRQLAAALVDLVLPAECPGCGQPGPLWCAACVARVGSPTRPALPGGPAVLAVGRYQGPLRAAVLRYKERGRRDLAHPLARLLAGLLGEGPYPDRQPDGRTVAGPVRAACPVGRSGPLGRADPRGADRPPLWLVPAPSRPSGARARGGDHMLRLCRVLVADGIVAGVAPALRLTGGVRDSVGLDAGQRAANLAGRLRVRPGALPPPGTRLLLVDDVVTTGATLRACQVALAADGVRADAAIVLCDATPGPPAQR